MIDYTSTGACPASFFVHLRVEFLNPFLAKKATRFRIGYRTDRVRVVGLVGHVFLPSDGLPSVGRVEFLHNFNEFSAPLFRKIRQVSVSEVDRAHTGLSECCQTRSCWLM